MEEKGLEYFELLAKSYPTIQDAAIEIINLKAILNLPKGTEHFLSDIHGEYDAFAHMVKSGSGQIKSKIDENLSSYTENEKAFLATVIYYPKEKLDLLAKQGKLTDSFYCQTISDMVEIAKVLASKYTLSKVRKSITPKFVYIIEELLQSHSYTYNKEDYYHSIVKSIIQTDLARDLIIELGHLIQKLCVDHLHILGDVYDRGEGAYRCMEFITEQRGVDITWGNHDIAYMGAASGSAVCIANVIRTSCRYNHLNTLEDGYGISIRPLVTFAMKTYAKDNCVEFIPTDEEANKIEDYDTEVIAKMHKAITIILFKLEGQLIARHKEYRGDYLLKLSHVDFKNDTYNVKGRSYKLNDSYFPTINPDNPYILTKDEKELVDKLVAAFKHCDKLQKHMSFMLSHGSMYLDYNYNLLFHGCIPTDEKGGFSPFEDEKGQIYKGKSYLDYLDKKVRKAFYINDSTSPEKDIFYFLWCFKDSPLYGKSDITTFERYFLSPQDRNDFKEEKNPYYEYVEKEDYCKKVLKEFGIDNPNSIIINGHMPVHVKAGESPVKAKGKYVVIDGGLSKAYHQVTGIAGYTLIYNSHGVSLISHDVFTSKEDAIKNNTDIAHSKLKIFTPKTRMTVGESYIGLDINRQIKDLEILLGYYREGAIKSN